MATCTLGATEASENIDMSEGRSRDWEEYEGSLAVPWPRLPTTIWPGCEDCIEGVVYSVKVMIRDGALT